MRDESGDTSARGTVGDAPSGDATSWPITDREAAKRLKIGLRRVRNLATVTGIGHRALIFSEADFGLLHRLLPIARPQAGPRRAAAASLPSLTKREAKIRRHIEALLTDRSARRPGGAGEALSPRGKRILKPRGASNHR